MSNRPLVSVGIPVYNGEHDLPNAVESLLTQSYSNLEIIISDNASTDRTQEVALELASRDPRVRYYRLEKNVGANGNFENVKNLATGEYFMWNGADDIRLPDSIHVLVEALTRNPQAVMAHGPIIVKLGDAEEHIPNVMDLSSLGSGSRVWVFTARMRHIAMEYGLCRLTTLREAVYKYRYRACYGDDYLICLQMCFLGPIEYVPYPMIVYRMRTVPPLTPMGEDIPLTGANLLNGSKRMWKSWSVLGFGCYYLLRLREARISQRLVGLVSHISAFFIRYKRRLVRDFVLISCSSIAAVVLTLLRNARRGGLPTQVDR